jgi:NAD(P)-dependent dehydrogenase (short-subunit alcohol dehydrogenase family)
LGLVRALNDEYAKTGKRFWLFSMGTMDTEMGRVLTDQDPTSFLSPDAVARRVVSTLTAADNLFEPEVVIRRRSIRFKEA